MTSDLVVFDFDFTIAKTYEKIWVWSPRGTRESDHGKYTPIHPIEFSKTKLANDEFLTEESFQEFYDIDIAKSKPIEPIIRYMKYHTHMPNDKILILSARPQSVEEKVMRILEKNDVHTSGIDFIGLAKSEPEAKSNYLKQYIQKNSARSLFLYEDNISVIKTVQDNIKNIVPCKFAHVTHHNNVGINFYE